MKDYFKLIVSGIAVCAAAVAIGCGGSSSDESSDAANAAAETAQAAQEQVADLKEELDQQQASLAKQTASLKKQRISLVKQKKAKAKQAANARAKKAKAAVQAKASRVAAAAEVAAAGPPDVVGLTLTTATKALKGAGYSVDASNDDTMFGIVNPDNYTVCTQDEPRGSIVPVLAQKYGC